MINLSDNFKALISSSGTNFLFRIFGLVTAFLTTFIITRLYGMTTFGNYSLVFTISQATAMIFTLGVPNTFIKIIGNHNFNYYQAKQLLIKGLKGVLFFSIVPIVIFFFFAGFLADTVFSNPDLKNYFLIVTISLPLFVVHELFLYFLIATKKFIKYNLFMFLVPNVLLIVFLTFFYYLNLDGHYTFTAFALAIAFTVVTEAYTIFERKPTRHEMPFRTRDLLRTASPLMFSGLLLYLLNWTNTIMLGLLGDETQVGVYNTAYKVGGVGFLVIVSISTIITPRMAELYGQGKLIELRKLTHNTTRLIALLSVPVVLLLMVFGKFILSLFGPEAVEGNTTLIIVAVGILFSAVAGNADQILNMTNNQKVLRNITFICFILNLVLAYWLIPKYGIEGAAVASLITNVLLNVLCVYFIKKRLGFYTLF